MQSPIEKNPDKTEPSVNEPAEQSGLGGQASTEGQHYAKRYIWVVALIGIGATALAVYRLPVARLDTHFFWLAILVMISSQVAVKIPRVSGRITVSDTLIFLTILLYGGEAAVLLSALDGISSSLPFTKKPRTILFNSGMLALSTSLTVFVLSLFLGSSAGIVPVDFSANYLLAICLMASVQYISNTSLIAVEKSYKIGQSFWATWKRFYLWTSVTYFAGASAAGIIAHLIRGYGFYAVIATIPIVAIIYLTYDTYLKNIEASEAQADFAQRHVEELSKYISELKRSEEHRSELLERERRIRAEAEAANRIKDEFLATLSHELRTPVTSLLGWANLLRSSVSDEKLIAEGLEVIERNAGTQAQLIEDLLDVSRIISGKLVLKEEVVDLSNIIEAGVKAIQPAVNSKSIQLTLNLNRKIGHVFGDEARLHQVIWNLLSNAVKFTQEGGRVDVNLEDLGGHARIVVRDSGKGIDPEFLPNVFDRFRQADSSITRAFGGLGIGLAIVRHLVELHGGTVLAESEGVGKGSVFSVTLPLRSAAAKAPGFVAKDDKEHPISLQGLRVLIVDDLPDSRYLIGKVLSRSGAEVRTCDSAQAALEMLQEWKPDVLMSDIGMPGEDGYSMIQKVRSLSVESGGAIPAAALTAYAREEDRQRALAAGYQAHLAKPVSSQQLVAAVAHLATLKRKNGVTLNASNESVH